MTAEQLYNKQLYKKQGVALT